MTVADVIAKSGITPSPDYQGEELNDDYILAIQTETTQTQESAWIVCQDHVKSHSAALNPKVNDDTYIRSGTVTTKTGNQRTFTVEGNRVVGDPFQDFCTSHNIMYGTGKDVVVPYVWFSIRTGKGESGQAAIIVNNDADGNAGDPAGLKLDLKAVGIPGAFTYSAS